MHEPFDHDVPQVAADELEQLANVLDNCGDHSVVCGLSAARLHGFWLPDRPAAVHIAIAEPGASGHEMLRTRLPDVRGHRRELAQCDIGMVLGVAATTPERTWVDLSSVLGLADLVAAGDSMLRNGVTRERVGKVLLRSASRRGVRRARIAFDLLDARSRSHPESHLRVATIAPDLPRFEVNVAVHREEGGWLAEPDLSLAAARIALEYQGADHAEPARMRKDISRSVDLRRDSWEVLLYGPAEVYRRPWQIAPELRALIRRRCPELLVAVRRPRRRRVVTSVSSGRATRDH